MARNVSWPLRVHPMTAYCYYAAMLSHRRISLSFFFHYIFFITFSVIIRQHVRFWLAASTYAQTRARAHAKIKCLRARHAAQMRTDILAHATTTTSTTKTSPCVRTLGTLINDASHRESWSWGDAQLAGCGDDGKSGMYFFINAQNTNELTPACWGNFNVHI